MKPIIVHSHIYKCAGTSIISSLKHYFGDGLILAERATPSDPFLGGNDIERLLCDNDSVCAISSHSVTCSLPKSAGGRKVIPIVLLRNPIQRARSVYYFNKKNPPTNCYISDVSKSSDTFDEWMGKVLYSPIKRSLINFQARFFLKNFIPSKDLDTLQINEAKRALFSDDIYIGTVERIHESLALWEYGLRKYYPNLDLSVRTENTTSNIRKSSSKADVLSDINLEYFTQNNIDFELHRLASARLDDEISKINNFSELLEDYKKRCDFKNRGVSVIIPAYNHGQFISQTLESIYSQTFRAFELIVVNDGSPDDTEETLRPHIESGKIRYIRQENQGVAAARNRGAAEARGAYLAFLDDDDCWPPDKLEWQVAVMESCDAVMVAGINDSERLPLSVDVLSKAPPFVPSIYDFFKRNMIGSPGQTLIRRVAFDAVGGFDPEVWGMDDYDLWIRLAHQGEIRKHWKLSLFYRYHDSNASLDVVRMAFSLKQVIRKNSLILGKTHKPKLKKLGYRYHFNYFGKKMIWKAGAKLFCGDFSSAFSDFTNGLSYYLVRMLKDPVLFGMVILTVLKIPIRARRYL